MLKLLREQKGSVVVLAAGAMVVLVAMAGLVVDVGYFHLQRTMMQNGVDAAALAGAAALPITSIAETNADTYAALNGLDPAKLGVTFSQGNKRVTVSYLSQVNTFFMRVLGINAVNISVAAAAQVTGGGGPFAFTIFSGSPLDILPLNGSRLYVDGSAHSNEDLRINGSGITITGVAEAVGKLFVNGNNITIGAQYADADSIPMPDYSAEVSAQAAAANKVSSGNKSYNGLINVNGSIHVNGSVSLNGNSISGEGAILASGPNGNIYINGNIANVSAGDQVALYSENGDIHINGNNLTIDGILYAPNGNIHINGNNLTVNGRIIGNTVHINGTNFRANGQNVSVTSLPGSGVQLVQ